jgi:hypothetical protein
MRTFYTLDQATINEESGVIYFSSSQNTSDCPELALRREGAYVAVSINHGPLEVAMRPKYPDFERVLARLRPVSGLQTTRQVGTGQSYIALGLRDDGALVLRPTIVSDATGLLCFNLVLSDEARQTLFRWFPVNIEND